MWLRRVGFVRIRRAWGRSLQERSEEELPHRACLQRFLNAGSLIQNTVTMLLVNLALLPLHETYRKFHQTAQQ